MQQLNRQLGATMQALTMLRSTQTCRGEKLQAVILRQLTDLVAQSVRLAQSSALIHRDPQQTLQHVVAKLHKPHCREHREGLASRLGNNCVAGHIATSQECRVSL